MENLLFGHKGITHEQVIEAAKISNAHDFISDLPYCYETMLDENGMNLSKGERQRIALARALLKKPDVLILDEPTNYIDAITEHRIEQAIYEYIKGVTVLIITNRLSTIKRCDRIYMFEKGRIAESGTYEELLELKKSFFMFISAL